MDFSEWNALSEEAQRKKCQFLDPYEDRNLFQAVEKAFWDTYREKGLRCVRCDLGPFIGPYNCILVEVREGESVRDLPEVFLGFPVITEAMGEGEQTGD